MIYLRSKEVEIIIKSNLSTKKHLSSFIKEILIEIYNACINKFILNINETTRNEIDKEVGYRLDKIIKPENNNMIIITSSIKNKAIYEVNMITKHTLEDWSQRLSLFYINSVFYNLIKEYRELYGERCVMIITIDGYNTEKKWMHIIRTIKNPVNLNSSFNAISEIYWTLHDIYEIYTLETVIGFSIKSTKCL